MSKWTRSIGNPAWKPLSGDLGVECDFLFMLQNLQDRTHSLPSRDMPYQWNDCFSLAVDLSIPNGLHVLHRGTSRELGFLNLWGPQARNGDYSHPPTGNTGLPVLDVDGHGTSSRLWLQD